MRKVRNIIHIDEELCNGCGQCILDCAEGALQLVDGKARLVGEIYCDGLGACLEGCPTGALTVSQREAEDFDEAAVEDLLQSQGRAPAQSHGGQPQPAQMPPFAGCPSQAAMSLHPKAAPAPAAGEAPSALGHWPIQLQLLAPQAPFLKNADLLLLADCTAASLPDLHARLLPGKAVAMACPKLDQPDPHIQRLAQIIKAADLNSLTVVIMEVPCCRGLAWIAQQAVEQAGVDLPVGLMVISRDGKVLQTQNVAWMQAA
ncbi:MAG: 4Fe-4S ferredoxin [Desulfarculus sp.]|nr:MAG: 4Fe-4S ferredoxin [Desulfarculus sp.]